MRNQYAKYKHPDGQKKNRLREVREVTWRFMNNVSMLFRDEGEANFTRADKKVKNRRRVQKKNRKTQRIITKK